MTIKMKMKMNKNSRGFTLIELLVVIAIIAILSVVVILTLNPAELLKQARDSSRISDLSTLNSALGVYYADVSSPTTSVSGATTDCYVFSGSGITPGSNCSFTGTFTVASTTSRAVSGAGWLPINFTSISSGAPIGNLPIDPVNSATNVYRFVASTSIGAYEMNANMESAKQIAATGVEQTDGGNSTTIYEVGTAPGLSL
jgi:prepilin-type N-terminal cleavage/methylation domain-containing protein